MRKVLLAPLCTAALLAAISFAMPLNARNAQSASVPASESAASATSAESESANNFAANATANNFAANATEPNWQQLDRHQAQISKTEFVGQLNTIFAPHGASTQTILVGNLGANILTEADAARKRYYLLTFAPEADSQATVRDSAGRAVNPAALNPAATATAAASSDASYWKPAEEIRKAATATKPLAGLHVAIDPGHIGGNWAYMEQREWAFGGGPVFREGDFVLRVAEILADDLRALGATVTLVRDNKEPLTNQRPEDFIDLARERLRALGNAHPTEQQLRRESELQFYRIAEIRARAQKVNDEIQPDIVVCLHVDGTSFPPAGATELPQGGTLHVLVNGAYSAAELTDDEQRLAMLQRMLSNASAEEIALADTVAKQLAIDTGLPPMTYTGPNAVRVNDNPFVWGRNLIANRLYDAPTVYIEAYTANREPFYQRFAHGEYDGTRLINGTPRKNVYREYADSVRDALLRHYAPQK